MVFSSSIPDVGFRISYTRAVVKMTVTHGNDPAAVPYEETLYPDYMGDIHVTDIGQIMAAFTERWIRFNLAVTVTEQRVDAEMNVTNESTRNLTTTQVVCCRANVVGFSPADFCSRHFLTLLDGVRKTSLGRKELLSYIGSDTPTCVSVFDDGTSRTGGVSVLQAGEGYRILDVSPENFVFGLKRLVMYKIIAGSRSQWYEVDYSGDPDVAPVLLFVNSFGVQEIAYCEGAHRQVSSFDRKQARIGKLKENYRIEETESFKADTGYLSFPMAQWWRDVLRSKEIEVLPVSDGAVVIDGGKPVVITSQKAEVSNEADHLPRYTFEYEYADRNHNIWEQPREGRIFDNTFDHTFN
jgi:hypothetical protein